MLPTGWAVVGAAVVLSWRALAWSSRAAFEQPDATLTGALLGIGADLCLVLAAFAVARAAGIALYGAFPRHASASRGALVVGLAVVVTGARVLDTAHCYLTGYHWAPLGFLHLDHLNVSSA